MQFNEIFLEYIEFVHSCRNTTVLVKCDHPYKAPAGFRSLVSYFAITYFALHLSTASSTNNKTCYTFNNFYYVADVIIKRINILYTMK